MAVKRLLLRPAIWIGAAILAAAAAGGVYWGGGGADPAPRFRLAKVEAGPIVAAVTATGTVNAVTTVLVGSQLSGLIKDLLVDYNSTVKAGDVVARLDTDMLEARIMQAQADADAARAQLTTSRASAERARADVETAHAALANARAQTMRADIQLADADREFKRRKELLARGVATHADFERAETALSTARAQLDSNRAQEKAAGAVLAASEAAVKIADAQILVAAAQVAQREAAVQQVQVDLDRSVIRSPIDGVVIQRNVDVGQTVAASLQAPTLFTIAQDLRRMEVWANVDEADIGRIAPDQPATFTVNSYPNENFRGTVTQIRLAPQTIQNVVTYIVIVSADNPDLKLLPGMTANLRIIHDQRDRALKVPNAALRYRPPGVAGPSRTAPATGETPRPGGQLDAFARSWS
ncbi:MAG: efflux RND transporter periplasmic adaptor subunit [Rhodospirillales bacterium]|nr:efflux RND transporter periplasmic adaptor subunit [Rhodospirillales bacterium]